MRTRRGFSFAEVLIALGILAMVLCGAMVFLQTNLVFYKRQLQGVGAAFWSQDLLFRSSESHGRVGNFDYVITEANEWLRLDLKQDSLALAHQVLRKPVSRPLLYQDFETQEWLEVDAEGCSEQLLGEGAVPTCEAGRVFWRGRQVYDHGSPIRDPQLDESQKKIAFACGDQVWVLDLDQRKALCWFTAASPLQLLAWHTEDSLVVQEADRLMRVSVRRSQVVYEGTLQQPSLSPDGHQIVFIEQREGTNDLVLYDRREKSARPIKSTPDGEIRPLWSRDWARILYGIAPTAGGTQLFCVNPDGSGTQDLHLVASGSNWKWR